MMKNLLILLGIAWALNSFGQAGFQQHFDSLALKGSTTIYQYKTQKWLFTNKQDAEMPTLPASTFKITNSLFALDYKAVHDENEVIKWDGTRRSHLGTVVEAWNKDTDLTSAYKNSTIWFYEEVAKRVGRERYREVLPQLKYGNGNLSQVGTDFWNYGAFAITPINQIEFLVKLYENRLPFSQKTMEKVKQIMVSEKTSMGISRDKTGWTRRSGVDIGWYVGYVETQDEVYFFATRLQQDAHDANPHFSKARKSITQRILHKLAAKERLPMPVNVLAPK